MKRFGTTLAILTAALAAAPAQAGWDFTRASDTSMGTSFNQAGTTTSGAASTVGVSAWGAALPPATFTASAMTSYSSSGLGINSDGSSNPNHAVDNFGNTEAVVLSFASSMVLSQVKLGWYSGDSDITVLRWVGDSTGPILGATPNMQNMTWSGASGLIASGWELVGSYADIGSSSAANVNAGSKASSWWLISAFNSTYGGAATGGLSDSNDYFKLASVAGNAAPPGGGSSAPEPASLALVAVALLGGLGVSRRKQK